MPRSVYRRNSTLNYVRYSPQNHRKLIDTQTYSGTIIKGRYRNMSLVAPPNCPPFHYAGPCLVEQRQDLRCKSFDKRAGLRCKNLEKRNGLRSKNLEKRDGLRCKSFETEGFRVQKGSCFLRHPPVLVRESLRHPSNS